MSHDDLGMEWYIDIRKLSSTEQISLDLSRHLPRRAAAGMVAIISDRPMVWISVVRKRWSTIIREVERQYASTLQQDKKRGLLKELDHLRSCRFDLAVKQTALTRVVFASFDQLPAQSQFSTIYVTCPLAYHQLKQVVGHLTAGGFLVTYCGWPESNHSEAGMDL